MTRNDYPSLREFDLRFQQLREMLDQKHQENKERQINVDSKFETIENKIQSSHNILAAKMDKTNGKVKMHTLVLSIVGAVVATLLITNGSELIHLFKVII